MSTMYCEYFGLDDLPFLSLRDIRFFYTNPVFEQATGKLREGITSRAGLLLLTGKPGTGKSTLFHKLEFDLKPCFEVISFQYTSLSWHEFLNMSCDALGIAAGRKSNSQKRDLVQQAFRSCASAGKPIVLLIDDAQNLEKEVLLNLVGLVYCDKTGELLVPIVFMATEDFLIRLARPEYDQLNERVCVRAGLAPLGVEEVGEFICSRLEAAGYEGGGLFTVDAVRMIAKSSEGIPQLINILCGAALLAAYGSGTKLVTAKIVAEVLSERREFDDVQADQRPERLALERLWRSDAVAFVLSRCALLLRNGLDRAKQAWGDRQTTTLLSRVWARVREVAQHLRGRVDAARAQRSDGFILPVSRTPVAHSPQHRSRVLRLRLRRGAIGALAVFVLAFWLYRDDPEELLPPQSATAALGQPASRQEETPPDGQATQAAASVGALGQDTILAEEEHTLRIANIERIRRELRTALEELGTTWEELLTLVSSMDAEQAMTQAQRTASLAQTRRKTGSVVESVAKLEALSVDTLGEIDNQLSQERDGAVSEESEMAAGMVSPAPVRADEPMLTELPEREALAGPLPGDGSVSEESEMAAGMVSPAPVRADEPMLTESPEREALAGSPPELMQSESLATVLPADTSTPGSVNVTTIMPGDVAPAWHTGLVAEFRDARWSVPAKISQAPFSLFVDTKATQAASAGRAVSPVDDWSTLFAEDAAIVEAKYEPMDGEPGSNTRGSTPVVVQRDSDALAATRQNQVRDADIEVYKVRAGDTLSEIARTHGVTLAELAEWNSMRAADRLYAGQVLHVIARQQDAAPMATSSRLPEARAAVSDASASESPPPELVQPSSSEPLDFFDAAETSKAAVALDPTMYEVQSGDTLSKIARQHNVDLARLARWNEMSLSDTLYPGQKLRVMGRLR